MKNLWIILCLLPFATANAQATDTAMNEKRKAWKPFLPHHAKLQYAGGIGFLSVGAGYTHANSKLETDIFFGYLPKSIGGDRLSTLALKSTFAPWHLQPQQKYSFYPFTTGAFMSYTFGQQFWVTGPDRYPPGYYGFPTSLRLGLFIGGRIHRQLQPYTIFRGIDLYYELGTIDLELISYLQNPAALSPLDILNVSFGIKTTF